MDCIALRTHTTARRCHLEEWNCAAHRQPVKGALLKKGSDASKKCRRHGLAPAIGRGMLEAMTRRRRILVLVAVAAVVGLGAYPAWRWYFPPNQINSNGF